MYIRVCVFWKKWLKWMSSLPYLKLFFGSFLGVKPLGPQWIHSEASTGWSMKLYGARTSIRNNLVMGQLPSGKLT